jgi:hypothetical protein
VELLALTDGPWTDGVDGVCAGVGALPDFCSNVDIYIKIKFKVFKYLYLKSILI